MCDYYWDREIDTHIIDEIKSKAQELHVGSPVLIGGLRTFVTVIDVSTKGTVKELYMVHGDSCYHLREELEGITLDIDFFRRHSSLYEVVTEGEYIFKGKEHSITLSENANLYHCLIDRIDYGVVKTEHELKWLLYNICGIHVPKYDGFRSKPASVSPVAE